MKRTSWIYCPNCRRDLNGDDASFVDDVGGMARYTCATCKTNSKFDLDAPAPIYLGAWSKWTDLIESGQGPDGRLTD